MELDRAGRPYGNRFIKAGETLVKDNVIRWQTDIAAKTDLSPMVETVSETFEITQFSRTRRVRVLLPHDYYENPDQRYPVLYMTDGQNLFGEGSEYGNWEIDKSLAKMAKEHKAGVIIVAVDHGEEDRVQELSPYDNPKLRQLWEQGRAMQQAGQVQAPIPPLEPGETRARRAPQNPPGTKRASAPRPAARPHGRPGFRGRGGPRGGGGPRRY